MTNCNSPPPPPTHTLPSPAGFPVPFEDIDARVESVRACIAAGAGEVDIVLEPGWGVDKVRTHMRALRAAAGSIPLKVILETAVRDEADVRTVCRVAIEEGADIVKTCTGRRGSAEPVAVAIMASVIEAHVAVSGRVVGLKVSGGVRTIQDARTLLGVARAVCPSLTLAPAHLRIGASGLLDALVPKAGTTATSTPGAPKAGALSPAY